MLDAVTKRRIDIARDILVGKVPDPKSQVEQITIALIYKFMDDMDRESVQMGGKASFFTGDYKKYAWTKMFDSKLGGAETFDLYVDAISKMSKNSNIPKLFRDIFKNAYLPYKDPETLKLFLKTINEFIYDHSEKLGDAFEYLLSVLGSQGEAGQFRTPRHIIDFIVSIIDPKKDETVLDPACGTAGFLISAYKHILAANMKKSPGDKLNPSEKKQLLTNFSGYDISPDMVRLSLVNLYLHGFVQPQIYEYDTLTSEERWKEYADVILANPPFMSPSGGIRPHKRFSIQSTRSEVLFVDYMAEHLNPNGRAGIIVPEGIIFQSGNAYKDLRKMLIDKFLVAVVSLPQGVFNPYSPVKTSILILDKSLAKEAKTIAFFKIENDGFGLGAQRRANAGEELTQVSSEIEEYFSKLRSHKSTEKLKLSLGLIVDKEKIISNGDYNLSGERYREAGVKDYIFPLQRLGDICKINPLKSELSKLKNMKVSFVPMADINENQMTFQPVGEKEFSEVSSGYTYFKDNDVLLSKVTPCFENGKAGIARGLINGIGFGSSELYVLRPNEQVLPEWIYFSVMRPIFRDSAIAQMTGTGGLQRVPRSYVEDFKIPLPPLEIQKEIVAEIESYQKVIDGARAILDNYRPHISIQPDWPLVKLGELCEIEHGFAFKGEFFVQEGPENLPVLLTPGNFMQGGGLYFTEKNTKRYSGDVPDGFRLKRGDLVLVMTDLSPMMKILGMPAIIEADQYLHNQRIGKVVLKSKQVLKSYLRYALLLDGVNGRIKREATGSTVRHTSPSRILSIEIPLPSLETQEKIVAEIEAEQALVSTNRELIERFEKKIQTTIARVWGDV